MEKSLHIKETELELFAYSPEAFSEEENKNILSHLDKCSLCKDIYNSYKNIYIAISNGLEKEPDEIDKELAAKIVGKFEGRQHSKLLTDSKTSVEIFNGRVNLVTKPKFFSLQYFIYIIKNYPVQTTGFAFIAALALAFIVSTIKSSVKDVNPAFIEIEKNIIKVYSRDADLLFKKACNGIPNLEPRLLMRWQPDRKRYINILDIDNDGINEILISGSGEEKSIFANDSLYCFSNKGELKWATYPELPNNPETPEWHRTTLRVQEFFTTEYGDDKKLFAISRDANYAGALISELNAETGEVVSTLYFAGWATVELTIDLENDGNDEIIIGGGDTFNKPFIMILKADKLKGVMPDFYSQNKNYAKGSAYIYLQLYFNLLSKYDEGFLQNPGIITISKLTGGGFQIVTHEHGSGASASGLQYAFNSNAEVTHISAGSEYLFRYQNLLENGFVTQRLDSNYYEMLKDSINYWDGDKFVNYHSANKYWNK